MYTCILINSFSLSVDSLNRSKAGIVCDTTVTPPDIVVHCIQITLTVVW